METKKLGFLILGLSLVSGLAMFRYMDGLSLQEEQLHCNPSNECQQVQSLFGFSHVVVGFLSFLSALGFYLLLFNKGEYHSINKYENYNNENISEHKIENNDKFNTLLKPLDDNQRKVLTSIKEQQGITQSTLRYRADLSKATVSQILTDFEKKDLISRKVKGKTYMVFLNEEF
jgi:uncharacterized membrane protein